MRVRVDPGGRLEGTVRVPGDKSIAHRWLILAATAQGTSTLLEVPPSLDVRSMAACLAALTRKARPALDGWAGNDGASGKGHRSTWNLEVETGEGSRSVTPLEVEGEGRHGLLEPVDALDCGNSGSVMRMLMGVVASAPFRVERSARA